PRCVMAFGVLDLFPQDIFDCFGVRLCTRSIKELHLPQQPIRMSSDQPSDMFAKFPKCLERWIYWRRVISQTMHPGLVGIDPGPIINTTAISQSCNQDIGSNQIGLDEVMYSFLD